MSAALSVIIPVYNNKNYLRQCVESVCNQTFSDLEILLVDDGSTDGAELLCDELACYDLRIKVLHKKNGGAISARKAGCAHASSQYVTFIDNDDWIEKEMYEYLFTELINNQVDIITSGFLLSNTKSFDSFQPMIYEKKALTHYIFPNMIHNAKDHTGGIISSVCNKIFKKELIEDALNRMDESLRQWEDVAYVYLACYRAKRIQITGEAFYHYRENKASVTRKYDPNYFFASCRSFAYIQQYFGENGAKKLIDQLIFIRFWCMVHALEIELERSIFAILYKKGQESTWRKIIQSDEGKEIINQINLKDEKIAKNIRQEMILLVKGRYGRARIVHDIYRIKKVYWQIRDRKR